MIYERLDLENQTTLQNLFGTVYGLPSIEQIQLMFPLVRPWCHNNMLRFVSYLKVSGVGFNDIVDRWVSTNFVTNTDIDTVEHNLRHIFAESFLL